MNREENKNAIALGNQTDLEQVKRVATILLETDIVETEFSPMIVQHPFTNTGFAFVQKEGALQTLNLTESEEDLRSWRETMKSAIQDVSDPYHLYMMINKPYALTFLKYAEPCLSQKDFSKILSSAWIMTEHSNSDNNVSKKELVSMFKKADPAILMRKEECKQLAALDDVITVYRGVTPHNARNIKALSWTLNYDTAKWFAERFNSKGTVYKAQIEKAHVFALFTSRNEAEIVLDPKYLQGIEIAVSQQEEVTELQMGGIS